LTSNSCEQCGAFLGEPAVTCEERFANLLALDHSRQEPWGSRHGLAFSAYTLQHPAGQSPDVLAEPADHMYGERQCTFLDPSGHPWTLSETVFDSDPADWGGELLLE
jgi:hypothetical protein